MDLGMSEIKPIDWDALPKVWAWDDYPEVCSRVVYTMYSKVLSGKDYICLCEHGNTKPFKNISLKDPRKMANKCEVAE